ncbi:MAG: ABC transporter ATP-binding protein [Peptostreptococcaceae bacterium]|nr:ABC transporter ATP-binding protein [Peptostreptococcaceae bacterium]
MNEHLLSVKDLRTYFYTSSGVVKAVDGVSFSLDSGKTLGIVGESGSGKSITAKSVIQLLPSKACKCSGGPILFDGKDMLLLKQKEINEIRGKDLSLIFQNPMTSLDPVFTVGNQMIELILTHYDISKEKAKEKAIEAFKKVGIPDPEKRMASYPYELSGGLCQRVIIAMAIMGSPKLIIADEPTTALDVTVQAQVLDLLKDLQKSYNTAILLITHDLGVIWDMCDTVMVMYAGKIVEFSDVKTLYSNALHPYTWGLLNSMPKVTDKAKSDFITIPGTPPDLRLTGNFCNFCNRCPYVMEECFKSDPEFLEVEEGHFVACHNQNLKRHLSKERK